MGNHILVKMQPKAPLTAVTFFHICESIVSWDYSATKKAPHGAACVFVQWIPVKNQ